MYRIIVKAYNGTVVLDLTHSTEQGAMLLFDSAWTFPGDTLILTHEGVELKRWCVPKPDPKSYPVHRPGSDPPCLFLKVRGSDKG